MVNLRKRTLLSIGCIVGIVLFFWTTPKLQSEGTVKIYDRNGVLLFEQAGNTGRKELVPFDKIPQTVKNAVIAAEDESFYLHHGVDLKAIVRSFLLNMKSGKIISGASTIDQQVVRLNTSARPANTMLRVVDKIREILTAIRLSLTHSKKDILEKYVNEVYLGNHNYGFQSAASFYFGKNIDKLSLNESSYLAGMIASPSLYDPYIHKKDGEKRKAYVLSRMGANGFITKEDVDTTTKTPCEFADPVATVIAPHFVDYVLQQLPKLPVPQQGISIYTTLDAATYRLGTQIAYFWVEKLKKPYHLTNAALIVLDNASGAIVSLTGGVNYYDTLHSGQVNMVTSPRQPGSAIKPITYTAAFLRDVTPATLIYDVKTSYTTQKDQGFIPNNFGDTYHGLVLAREALASSYNLPAVEILHRIGLPAFLDTAKSLGITTYEDSAKYDLAITLGANEVSLLELSNAYATIARGGKLIQTYAIEKITDSRGKTVYTHTPPHPVQRLGPDGPRATYLVTDILSDSQARMPGFGEKNFLTLSRPAAVKTGTTSDWHDIWTIGYTPSYTVGVWMGNNNNDAMQNISSAQGTAPVWNQFFEEFLKNKPTEEFQKPPGLTSVEICTLSGDLYDGLCPERKSELFIRGTEPKKISSLHKLARIDTRSGLLADISCPSSVVQNQVRIDYPPEVFSWAVANHKPYLPHEYSPLCNTSAPATSLSDSIVTVTNPKNKTTYQNAPGLIRHQGIPLEVSVSPDIIQISWYVDNIHIGDVDTTPFTLIIPLQTGNHVVYAEGKTKNKRVKSSQISFSVVDFH